MNATRNTTMTGLVCCLAVLGWTTPLAAQVLGGSLGGTLQGGLHGGLGAPGRLDVGSQLRTSAVLGARAGSPASSADAAVDRAKPASRTVSRRVATGATDVASIGADVASAARADAHWTAGAATTAAAGAMARTDGPVMSGTAASHVDTAVSTAKVAAPLTAGARHIVTASSSNAGAQAAASHRVEASSPTPVAAGVESSTAVTAAGDVALAGGSN